MTSAALVMAALVGISHTSSQNHPHLESDDDVIREVSLMASGSGLRISECYKRTEDDRFLCLFVDDDAMQEAPEMMLFLDGNESHPQWIPNNSNATDDLVAGSRRMLTKDPKTTNSKNWNPGLALEFAGTSTAIQEMFKRVAEYFTADGQNGLIPSAVADDQLSLTTSIKGVKK